MEATPWSARDVLLLGLTIVAWGSNYLFVKIGLGVASPFWLAALRAGVGLLALAAFWSWLPRGPPLEAAKRRDALLLGLPNTAIFLGLWFSAEEAVPPGQAAVLVYTFPLWVALLSVPVLRARLGPRHWSSISLGFVGVLAVSQPWQTGGRGTPLLAVVELLTAAFSWAFATVLFQRRFARSELAQAYGYLVLAGSVALLAFAGVTGYGRPPTDSATLWIAVAWLGGFGTAFAYAVWFHLLGKVPAAALSAYAFLVPLVALGASVVLLGERLTIVQAVGVAAVVIGIYGVTRARAGGAPAPIGTLKTG